MRNFSFYNPTRIHFGEGQIGKQLALEPVTGFINAFVHRFAHSRLAWAIVAAHAG